MKVVKSKRKCLTFRSLLYCWQILFSFFLTDVDVYLLQQTKQQKTKKAIKCVRCLSECRNTEGLEVQSSLKKLKRTFIFSPGEV